ncbi:protein RESTRICTED TEV MOVEMENT 1-like [Chenopodium quinoa]|uniref:protein RESTRICTED TEV MOVEMENT 1-like n=1 Tax=Chenopodium quinoa TaxID=63459 RepID=UPI000B78B71D|nr:protein RESTRICTED TEV MOVEMENT 1-like [Chenopodium quinoa]
MNMKTSKLMNKVGPSGNKQGKVWDLKGCNAIVQFIVSYEPQKINSLQFHYIDEDDNGRLKLSEIKLDYPNEYITMVRGWYSDSGVEELTVSTNKMTYLFGKASESDDKQWFWYDLGGFNQFGGFHGTCDSDRINSIGVYFKPATEFVAPSTTTPKAAEPSESVSDLPLI